MYIGSLPVTLHTVQLQSQVFLGPLSSPALGGGLGVDTEVEEEDEEGQDQQKAQVDVQLPVAVGQPQHSVLHGARSP